MSCSPFDLRDYFLKELTDAERRQMDIHVKNCPECHDQLERLRATEAALLALRDEEIPQRIGFVSDKVFEPSAARRWWQAFWGSTARLGFAAAAMLSVAIVVAALSRPAPAPQLGAAASQAELARMEAAFTARLDQAVQQAVAQSEARQAQNTARLLAAAETRSQMERKELMLVFDENLRLMKKRLNAQLIASNREGARQ